MHSLSKLDELTCLCTFSPESSRRAFIRDIDGCRGVADKSFERVQPVIRGHCDTQTDERRQRAQRRRGAQHRLLRTLPHHVVSVT